MKNIPEGATHFIDDEDGFDYLRIDMEEMWMDVWNARFNCWLTIGYIAKSNKYKELK